MPLIQNTASIALDSATAVPAQNLNVDPNPIVVRKKPIERVQYKQNVSLKLLKPPPPPPAGDIIVQQEPDVQAPPEEPLVIRQQAPKPKTPEPIVVRERPPKPPREIPDTIITIPGKVIRQPRKVIIERLPAPPQKPPKIIVEKWLAYDRQKREVVVEKKPAPITLEEYQRRQQLKGLPIGLPVEHNDAKVLPIESKKIEVIRPAKSVQNLTELYKALPEVSISQPFTKSVVEPVRQVINAQPIKEPVGQLIYGEPVIEAASQPLSHTYDFYQPSYRPILPTYHSYGRLSNTFSGSVSALNYGLPGLNIPLSTSFGTTDLRLLGYPF